MARAATPTVIVSTARPIHAIATSSSSLVWRQDGGGAQNGCNTWVRRRTWGTGARSDVSTCRESGPSTVWDGWLGDFAMGTSRVAFTAVGDDFDCCEDWIEVWLNTPPLGIRDDTTHQLKCYGDQIVNLTAHADLAAYTRAVWTPTDPNTDCYGQWANLPNDTVTGGPVDTLNLAGGKPRPLAGAPPSAFIRLSAVRIALVPYDLASAPLNRYPPPLPQIQVWNLHSRTREHTISETGTIKALDMAGNQIAVLVADTGGNLRIDRFSTLTGAATGSTAVPAQTAPMLAVYYNYVAYVVGTHVLALNTDTGVSHTVATPTYTPRQILAVRGKAVWYASAHGWGRILTAPIS